MNDVEVIEHLARVAAARKTFDANPRWIAQEHRESGRLDLVVALRLDGILGGGASVLLSTPASSWERDVYGQIKVNLPGRRKALRVCPVEWRPLKVHRNPGDAPPSLRFAVLSDRWHPFDLNRDRPLSVFAQDAPGVAAPLPRAVESFSEYSHLCADLWDCPDMRDVPPPPWARVLL